MKFKRKDSQTVKILLLLLVLVIGIGYAYLTSNLSITGATAVAGNTWDIHFENVQISPGSVEASTPATINPSDNTKIDYAVLLNRPGKYYEFTVDMVNSGSLPGKVSLVDFSGITPEMEDVVDYSVVYTNNNSPVAINDILNGGSSKNIKVKLLFKEDIEEEDLLDVAEDLSLSFEIVFVQSEEDEVTTDTIIQQLKAENSSCFTKYEGQVTDQVGQTVTAQNVYFNKCADKRNIKFNNMCWQMIRTTETGGIKMIYNGEPDNDGICGSSRGDHKGIVGAQGSTQTLNAEYLYGDSFTYDITNNTFTLIDTITATWSDSTYQNLLGKFTCMNTTGTCTTLYNVNGYSNSTTAYTSSYTIGDTNYAQIGTSSFNANYESPAMVGYMFNKVYDYKSKSPGKTEYKYGSGFTYDTNTNTYTLSGTTQNISLWSSRYNTINNTHYTCWNTSGTCNAISYIHYTSLSNAYYFDITGGKDVRDILEEMLSSNDVNRYNSSIKGIIDAWYKQNMISKTNMLEDTVYCNARNIINYGGWDPEGGSTTSDYYIKFKNYISNNDISCANETDQFAVSNASAKLTYPVALATYEELFTLTNNNSSVDYSVLTKTNASWWGLSSYDIYNVGYASDRGVYSDGDVNCNFSVYNRYGVRLVVSLNAGAVISSGDGSEESPWVID